MTALGSFTLGIFALIAGAELITRAGARLAVRLGIPPIVIGLTIVSVGTSTPELAIGVEAAVRGNGALAVGNIAGTNTVNLLLILGLSALLRPLALGMQTLRFDLPIMTLVAFALIVMAWDGALSRAEGGAMVIGAVVYTAAIVLFARRESRAARAEFARAYPRREGERAGVEIASSFAALIVGIAAAVLGSDWLVDGAVTMARLLGVSDAFIGLTIVAIGTSSPELVTTIIGTLRNDRDIAIGNLLGSSIYNILAILGFACLIAPMDLPVEPALVNIHLPMTAAATLMCVPVFLSDRRISQLEGGLFLATYAGYLFFLLVART